MALTNCPACERSVSPGETECLCGLVLAKWEKKMAEAASFAARPASSAAQTSSHARQWSLGTVAILLLLVLGGSKMFVDTDERDIAGSFDAYRSSVLQGSLEGLIGQLTEKKAGEYRSPKAAERLARLRSLSPDDYKIVRSEIKGDLAALRLRGTYQGETVKGQARLRREEGMWKVANVFWNLPLDAKRKPPEIIMPAESPKEESIAAPQGEEGLRDKTVPELLTMIQEDQLKDPPFAELLRRREKAATIPVVLRMLRDKDRAMAGEAPQQLKTFLHRLGATIPYDYYFTAPPPTSEDEGYSLVRWSIELRDQDLFGAVQLFVGQDVVDGLDRKSSELKDFIPYVKFAAHVAGPGLGESLRKDFDVPKDSGILEWDNIPLQEGLGPGEFKVALTLDAMFIDTRGEIRNISKESAPLFVVIR